MARGSRKELLLGLKVQVQPLSIVYSGLDGLPLGRADRPSIAWYGDMSLGPHLLRFLAIGPVDVTLSFGEAFEVTHGDRKALAKKLGDEVRQVAAEIANGRARRFDEAQRELEESLRRDPGFADAHQLLADLLMAKGQAPDALRHYREALRIRPESGRAELGLGSALATVGDVPGAIAHLRKAAADSDPAVRAEASQTLRQLGIQ